MTKATPFEIAVRVEGAGPVCQDRADAFPFADGHLLVVADGAGGTAGGAEAAQLVLDVVRGLNEAELDWSEVLRAIDIRLASNPTAGETTAVVAFVRDASVVGASVGDSGAWLIVGGDVVDLTVDQHRKPLLGSRRAVPVSFGPTPLRGRLVLGSDGLFKYATASQICGFASLESSEAAINALVEATRLTTGGLQDDVAVILAGRPE